MPQPAATAQAEKLTLLIAACPLCAAVEFRPLAQYPQFTWVECGCGLIYKRSIDAAAGGQDYSEQYFGSDGDSGGRSYVRRTRRRVQKSRHQILDLLNHVPAGPLLDVGCSVGYTLQAARALGLDCAGVDVSAYAVQTCREQGFRAEQAALDALPFADGEFALATMKHVLEHTPEPRRALAEVRRVVRPGGGIFIAVPHAGYRRAVAAPQSYGFYLPDRHGTEHFVYYTPATLGRLLQEEGFAVCHVHPHLVHSHAGLGMRLLQRSVAPLRWGAQRLADRLSLRKEFWLVARRRR